MKQISRREFIAGSLLLLSATHFKGNTSLVFLQDDMMDKLGLQLGCVREQLISQPQQTLEFIHGLGLRNIEFPNVDLLKKLYPVMNGMGFKVHSSHFASPYVTGNWEPYTAFGNKKPGIATFSAVVEEAKKYNLKYLVLPDVFPQDRSGLELFQSFSEQLNKAGEICKEAGIQLCYHNHNFEFQPIENTSPIEVMLSELDPDLVKLELDVFYLSVAGIDIQEFTKKYSQHIALLHLGDIKSGALQSYRSITLPQEVFQPLGKGSIDFKYLLQSPLLSDIPYYFINLEQSADILADLKSSVEYLKTL